MGSFSFTLSLKLIEKNFKKQKTSISILFQESLGRFLHVFLATIIYIVSTFVGFLLLIIPGYFLTYKLQYMPFSAALKNKNALEAFGESRDLTGGRRWTVFGRTLANTILPILILYICIAPFMLLGGIYGGKETVMIVFALGGILFVGVLIHIIILQYSLYQDLEDTLAGHQEQRAIRNT